MNAEKIMKKGLVSCRQGDARKKALGRMDRYKMGNMPVVNDNGRLIGLVDREVLERATSLATVGPAMSRRVFCVRPSDTLSDVEASLREQGLATIPVIDDDGALRGVVNLEDLPWSAHKALNTTPELEGHGGFLSLVPAVG